MKDKMNEGTLEDTKIAIEAGEAVALMIEAMLDANAKENEQRVADIKTAFRVGEIKLRASLDFTPDGLVAFMLSSVSENGRLRTISRAEFMTPKSKRELN